MSPGLFYLAQITRIKADYTNRRSAKLIPVAQNIPCSATGDWLLATGDWQLATDNRLLATASVFGLPSPDFWLLATGYWQLATGYWLLATASVFRLPSSGYWQLTTYNLQLITASVFRLPYSGNCFGLPSSVSRLLATGSDELPHGFSLWRALKNANRL